MSGPKNKAIEIIKQFLCTHASSQGSYGYLVCRECGLTWDETEGTAMQEIMKQARAFLKE